MTLQLPSQLVSGVSRVDKQQIARFDVNGQRIALHKPKRSLPLTAFQRVGNRVVI
ncbi:MAG UNVERIFIED_CONTAM: hypothetical protein LVR18_24655 [Planctomycetaceae bacterium]